MSTEDKEGDDPRVVRKEIGKILPVKLTDKELLAAGREAADSQEELRDVEGQAKAASDEYKGKMKAITGRIVRLASLVRAGYEHREVACEQVFDYEAGTLKVTRLDTREIVERRPLRSDERQMVLAVDEDARIAAEIQKEQQEKLEQAQEPPAPEGEEEGDPPPGKDYTVPPKSRANGPITDEELQAAVEVIRESGRAATSVIQRRLKMGFMRATAIISEMEQQGFIGMSNGTAPREIIILPEAGTATVVPKK